MKDKLTLLGVTEEERESTWDAESQTSGTTSSLPLPIHSVPDTPATPPCSLVDSNMMAVNLAELSMDDTTRLVSIRLIDWLIWFLSLSEPGTDNQVV